MLMRCNYMVQLLKERNRIPSLSQDIDDIVLPIDEGHEALRPQAALVATQLRGSGRCVDHLLENRKLKWVFKHAERVNAKRIVLVGTTEWEKGCVREKDLATRQESDLPLADLD